MKWARILRKMHQRERYFVGKSGANFNLSLYEAVASMYGLFLQTI